MENKLSRKAKIKNNLEELSKLSKEELIDKVIKLEAYNFQLKNVIDKKFNEKHVNDINGKEEEKKREFDFSQHHKRHILLKFCYLGWNYTGFVVQDGFETGEKFYKIKIKWLPINLYSS